MKLIVEQTTALVRFIIEEDEPWSSSTFFPQLDTMLRTIKATVEEGPRHTLFDLSRLNRVDSSLVAVIVQTLRITGTRRISVISPHHDITELLHLMGLDRLMDIYSSEENRRNEKIVES